MHNQSPFVKIVIWFMIFLMSVGFAALVVTPFLGGGSFFSDDEGRGATKDLVDEARADIRDDRCGEDPASISGARKTRCKDALAQLATSYRTLASIPTADNEAPADSQRNIERAGDAYKSLYELDTKDNDNAEAYASYLRDTGESAKSLTIWTQLAKREPSNEDYLLQQASAYEGTQQIDEAIAGYQAYIKRFPESGQVDSVKDRIKELNDQKAAAASGGGAGGLGGAGGITATGPDGQPISIG